MKKIGLIILLTLALTAGFAQNFSATYNFGSFWESNVASLTYNGPPVLGLNMGNIEKVGVDSWTNYDSFRAVRWPGADVIDTGKYIGFEMTVAEGYQLTITSIEFGISKSVQGARKAEWRGSSDNYATSLPGVTVTSGSATFALTVDTGVITIPERDRDTYWGGNSLDPGSAYENITGTCGFRFYMYDAMAEAGDSGLYQELKINGTVTPIDTNTTLYDVEPASISGLTYYWGSDPQSNDYRPVNVGGYALSGYTVTVSSGPNIVMTAAEQPLGHEFEFTVDHNDGWDQVMYVGLKQGLPLGDYTDQITVVYSPPAGSGLNNEYRYIYLSGSVLEVHRDQYQVDFEGAVENKTLYDAGYVYLNELKWILDGVKIETEPAYVIGGNRSARLSGDRAVACMAMEDMKICGSGTISFDYRFLNNGTQASTWVVERNYDETGDQNWVAFGNLNSGSTSFSRALNTKDNVRIRIRRTGAGHDLLLDNFTINNYCDFYNGIEKEVVDGAYGITISGGNGNYEPDYVLDTELPINGLIGSNFHDCITLVGGGTFIINTAVKNPDPRYTYYTAYKDNYEWHTLEMTDYTATFTMSLYNNRAFVPNTMPLELLIGYTEKAHTVPVTLSHFSATMTAENYVNLTWISQTETGLMGYNVLRSAEEDLSSARQICALIEATNTSQAQTYTYLDKDLVEDGTYYYWLQSVETDGSTNFHGPASVIFSITGDSGSPSIPKVTKLEDAYPNPFNPNTTLRYQLESPGKVKIDIYNQRGQLVRSFERSHDAAGYYSILWDGCDGNGRALASGVYLYRMTSGSYAGVKKMILQK
jgi:hypothetical protein